MARVQKVKPAPARKKAKPAAAVEKPVPATSVEKPVAAMAERAKERRHELEELKAELARQIADQSRSPSGDAVTRWLNSTQENDVRTFVESKSTQMNQRKYQLSLVKNFLDNPAHFGLDPGDMPTSTSLPEFADRRKELEYRIGLLRTFLDILNEELRALDQAEAYARKNGAGPKT